MTDQPHDDRRSARSNVLLAATLQTGTSPPRPVRIANLSASGALIFGDLPYLSGQQVTLVAGTTKVTGSIAWIGGQHAGIAFNEPIDPHAILPTRVSTATMIMKDEREADFRRPGFKGNQLSVEERQTLEEWKRSEREGQ